MKSSFFLLDGWIVPDGNELTHKFNEDFSNLAVKVEIFKAIHKFLNHPIITAIRERHQINNFLHNEWNFKILTVAKLLIYLMHLTK